MAELRPFLDPAAGPRLSPKSPAPEPLPVRWSKLSGRRAPRCVAALLLASAAVACGSSNPEVDPGGLPDDRPPPQETPEDEVEIEFESSPPIPLAPREGHEVAVTVRPPASYTVRFALVGGHDAALDRSTVVSDTRGGASVWLTAPSVEGTFAVRAQVGRVSSTLDVSVVARMLATLEIAPVYNGRRAVNEWVASVHERSCAELSALLFRGDWSDGPQYARFAMNQNARFTRVNTAEARSVVVRAGQFAAGCTDITNDPVSERLRVEVPVTDRPLDLARTELELALALAPADPAFVSAIQAGSAQVRSAFRGDRTNDPAALLDAMWEALTRVQRPDFERARTDAAWDDALLASQDSRGPARLTDTIGRWVSVGQSALFAGRVMEGRLAPPQGTDVRPRLEIARVGQIDAQALELDVTMTTWMADASDTLSFAANVSWRHPRLIAALARGPAIAETGASDVPNALAAVANCEGLGAALLARELPATAALAESCNAMCLAVACRSALGTLWDRAQSNVDSEELVANLTLAAAGNTTVGERAQVVALDGSWVGKLTVGTNAHETSGPLQGTAPRYTVR